MVITTQAIPQKKKPFKYSLKALVGTTVLAGAALGVFFEPMIRGNRAYIEAKELVSGKKEFPKTYNAGEFISRMRKLDELDERMILKGQSLRYPLKMTKEDGKLLMDFQEYTHEYARQFLINAGHLINKENVAWAGAFNGGVYVTEHPTPEGHPRNYIISEEGPMSIRQEDKTRYETIK